MAGDNESKSAEGQRIPLAAALHYQAGEDQAPQVVAAGRGLLAERILELARQAGVPVTQDENLVKALVKLGAGREIPPELYQVVAQVLAHVWRWEKELSS